MRIISNFKDYYDCIKATDPDQEPVYIRNVIQEKYNQGPRNVVFSNYMFQCHCTPIIFCDRIYYCMEMSRNYPLQSLNKKEFHYTINGVEKFIRTYDPEDKHRWFSRGGPHKNLELFVGNQGREIGDNIKKLIKNYPIYYVEGDFFEQSTVYNGRLDKFHFQKIKPPHEAYQELRMWLSNQSNPEKHIPKIDDKTLMEAKGFDKFSFKKRKK